MASINFALILLGIFGGIPLLSTLASAFGALNSAKYAIDKADILPPASPQIFLPYEATNSAKQNITGQAEPGSVVYLTYNNQPGISSVAKDDGKFQFNNLTLTTGSNVFKLMAVDKAGNERIEILEPQNPSKWYESPIAWVIMIGITIFAVVTGRILWRKKMQRAK